MLCLPDQLFPGDLWAQLHPDEHNAQLAARAAGQKRVDEILNTRGSITVGEIVALLPEPMRDKLNREEREDLRRQHFTGVW